MNRHVCPAPVLIDLRVQLQLAYAKAAQEPCDRDGKHALPDDLERFAERLLYPIPEQGLQLWNDRYRRVCNIDAMRELRGQRRRQLLIQLVLQESAADGDAPYLAFQVSTSCEG